ncbi:MULTISPECIES: cytochrome c biogenesis protein CcdA [Synechococcaceae]|uniref:cytochrome c biogenesis protein CcdA n=1 Tax=Synechococcaceae TaxID=1890426 RepID=UPI0019693514|nr:MULTISPECIES: cytochrome c biogenesis protein CcdA [Synechococcaceae]MCT0246194.1 cytochrome c biogenesis protein CcdA [Synechococcus sp. CS-601]MCT4367804.1 cytochrome c biogenesis protein CcdA [Candidatus Regnicoccus frigidus MAG-AL2]
MPRQWKLFGALVLTGLLIALLATGPLSLAVYRLISIVENHYQEWFSQQDAANPFVLLPLAFTGGLIASVSPCILAMLPINLSYIGTRNITSRQDAFNKAGLFVLGNVVILSLFGLASSFAGLVMIEYRGFINIAVGAIILLMGCSLLGVIKVPLPQVNVGSSTVGPFGVGLTFALVSSPCSSPVLFAVLAAAAASGSQPLAVLTMTSYALGYTIIIFLASLLAGFAKQAKLLLEYSEEITKFGSIALILAGLYYLITGVGWFMV